MAFIKLEDIAVSTERQRKHFNETELSELAESIKEHGLLQPIVVEKLEENSYILIAGERRLRAHVLLGKSKIDARAVKNVTSVMKSHILEWEENERRADLTWQERTSFIFRFHCELVEEHADTETDWNQELTGQALGLNRRTISKHLQVCSALLKGNDKLNLCNSVDTAHNIVKREVQRASDLEMSRMAEAVDRGDLVQPTADEILADLNISVEGEDVTIEVAPSLLPQSPPIEIHKIQDMADEQIIKDNFLDWAPIYDGPRFDFIHLDPPYGIDHGKSEQGNADIHGGYEDSEAVYWEFLETFCKRANHFIAPKAHIMMWFSMNHYATTREVLLKYLPFDDVRFFPFPLIWHKSDGTGMMPDVTRQPQRIYETALMISVGDRRIIEAVPNLISFPAAKQDAKHLSEKPMMMLDHFFRMFVDTNTRVLDPCCGSGSAIARSIARGAPLVLGMDIAEEHVETARIAVRRANLMLPGVIFEEDK